MKSTILLSFAFLIGSSGAVAQSTSAPPSYGISGMEGVQAQVQSVIVAHVGCPVSLRAQHGADGNMMKVDKGRPSGLAQRLHLVLGNPDSKQIVSASLTARGLSGKARMTQTMGTQDQPDATKRLEVRFHPDSDQKVTGDAWVPGMSAVLSVELNSVTFADGTTRRFAPQDGCRVAPDPLMLIADK